MKLPCFVTTILWLVTASLPVNAQDAPPARVPFAGISGKPILRASYFRIKPDNEFFDAFDSQSQGFTTDVSTPWITPNDSLLGVDLVARYEFAEFWSRGDRSMSDIRLQSGLFGARAYFDAGRLRPFLQAQIGIATTDFEFRNRVARGTGNNLDLGLLVEAGTEVELNHFLSFRPYLVIDDNGDDVIDEARFQLNTWAFDRLLISTEYILPFVDGFEYGVGIGAGWQF